MTMAGKTDKATPRKPRRNYGRRVKRALSGRAKLPSLSKLLILGGLAALTTSIGAKGADQVMAGVQRFAGVAKVSGVTGAGLVAAAVGLRAACSISPFWFGPKYRAFLRGYGLRP